jgi:osmoprotectant transport system substrate-binding protein
MSSRSRLVALTAIVVAVSLGAAACGSDKKSGSSSSSSKPAVTIAAQKFDEGYITSQIYGQLLAANGYKVTYKVFADRATIYSAVKAGDANFISDYAASGLEYLDKNAGLASSKIATTVSEFQKQLAPLKLKALDPTNAVDTNALVVTKATASSKHLSKISDLTPDLKLGAPQDCPTNAGCLPALKSVYGIDLSKNYVALDSAGPLTVKALQQGDVDVAVLFSTSPAIAVNGWKILTDDKGMFKSDNIIPVVTDALDGNSQLVSLVNKASQLLTTSNVTAMNKSYDIDKEDASAIAKKFLTDNKLIK